jgi:hypothetical protein
VVGELGAEAGLHGEVEPNAIVDASVLTVLFGDGVAEFEQSGRLSIGPTWTLSRRGRLSARSDRVAQRRHACASLDSAGRPVSRLGAGEVLACRRLGGE